MRLKIKTLIVVASVLSLALLPTMVNAKTDIDVEQLIKEIDELYRSSTSYTELEMEIITPHWQRTLAMYGWSKGKDKTFIRITSPRKEKGIATLRVDNEMWNYLPKTNKIMKIPPSMMMGAWMGSDFTNDDLVKESSLLEDYTFKLIHPDSAIEGMIYINCIPREDLAVVWGNIVIIVRESNHLPVTQEYYDEKGKLMRVMNYSNIKELGGRTIPSVLEMVPQTKEGHKTIIRYLKAEFNINLSDDTFTLRNLRSRD
ncbi:MAG: outer membrane lipoprotein-sorting protein [candidate division Zixibacteria bacterium]|nr:outer membrane lipoprotein-sorting protein [candidate division Zixibacteria bacterium]